MSTHPVQDGVGPGSIAVRQRISISLNEPHPAWDRILTAHDVARLIRRPPWIFCGMAAVGQFPQGQRFRGRNIGWPKADILEWMAHSSRYGVALTRNRTIGVRHRAGNSPSQQVPPLQRGSIGTVDNHSVASSVTGACL
jgi:predicted DNA-binding transcriptional regulator AlpA